MGKKRIFGFIRAEGLSPRRFASLGEAVFDTVYLCTVLAFGVYLMIRAEKSVQLLAGVMASILGLGDAFHLVPRIRASFSREPAERFRRALGVGKLVTSVSMTVFYVLLWHVGMLLFPVPSAAAPTVCVYVLAAVRILLCFMPQNGWTSVHPPVSWAVFRNIPFFLLAALVAWPFAAYAGSVPAVTYMWLAIALSFLFYVPVVLFSDAHPAVGALMIPKTAAYVWIVVMCLFL